MVFSDVRLNHSHISRFASFIANIRLVANVLFERACVRTESRGTRTAYYRLTHYAHCSIILIPFLSESLLKLQLFLLKLPHLFHHFSTFMVHLLLDLALHFFLHNHFSFLKILSHLYDFFLVKCLKLRDSLIRLFSHPVHLRIVWYGMWFPTISSLFWLLLFNIIGLC